MKEPVSGLQVVVLNRCRSFWWWAASPSTLRDEAEDALWFLGLPDG